MIVAAVTARESLGGRELLDFVDEALRSGVDWLQIREKDLSGRDLIELCRAVRRLANPNNVKLIVNGRVDVALAATFDGVHLPADAIPADRVREIVGDSFMIGASCHSLDELGSAAAAGADYAFYAPVFASASKPGYGPPLGVSALRTACQAATIPVLALGGIRLDNAAACRDAGAAGVAAISLFQNAASLRDTVDDLRRQS